MFTVPYRSVHHCHQLSESSLIDFNVTGHGHYPSLPLSPITQQNPTLSLNYVYPIRVALSAYVADPPRIHALKIMHGMIVPIMYLNSQRNQKKNICGNPCPICKNDIEISHQVRLFSPFRLTSPTFVS